MTDSCANFITGVRYCCGTINCVKVLPCSTFGELNFRYNKSFFFKNVALPMVLFASHRLLVVVRLTSSFWALRTCAGVMVLSIIFRVFSLLVTPYLLACALVCTANAGTQFMSGLFRSRAPGILPMINPTNGFSTHSANTSPL